MLFRSLAAETLLSNDIGDNLKIIKVSNAVNGSVILTENGDIEFIPALNFTGMADFEYTVDNGQGDTDKAVVFVEITPGTSIDTPDTTEDTNPTGNPNDNPDGGDPSDLEPQPRPNEPPGEGQIGRAHV